MRVKDENKKALIYSCSGSSNVAQLANDIAVRINAEGIAEMSCIAGVGGKVKSLVKKAQSNRPIIVIDGCALQCAKQCFTNVDIEPSEHVILTDYNLKKRYNSKFDLEAERYVYDEVLEKIEKIRTGNQEF